MSGLSICQEIQLLKHAICHRLSTFYWCPYHKQPGKALHREQWLCHLSDILTDMYRAHHPYLQSHDISMFFGPTFTTSRSLHHTPAWNMLVTLHGNRWSKSVFAMVIFGSWHFKRAVEHFVLWFNRNRSESASWKTAHVSVAGLHPRLALTAPVQPHAFSQHQSTKRCFQEHLHSLMREDKQSGHPAEGNTRTDLLGTSRPCSGLNAQNHRYAPSMEQAIEAVNAAENFCRAFHVSKCQPPVCWGRVWTSWCK